MGIVAQVVAQQPPVTLAVTPREALSAAPWLAAVPAATLDRLASQAVLHRMPAGSMLFEQAETPAFMLCLINGSVELLGVRGPEETLIELLSPVDLLLPAAVLNRQPYLMRARSLSNAQIMLIQAETFRAAVASDHALCLAVLACEAAHFRRQVKHAKNVKLRSAEERVGCYLLKLTEEIESDQPVRLPMEKRLIASQLGMTRETFSRTLAAVARQGLRVEGDHVIVEDIAVARARFRLDPLIDGPEAVIPLPIRADAP
jgi:CRP/FNR family transcriptional activator FtrB